MSKKNVKDFLRVRSRKEMPSKSVVPSDLNYGPQADDLTKAYTNFKDSEAIFREKESKFLEIAGNEYEKNARNGEFSKSINFIGEETQGVQITWQDRFGDIPIEHEKQLKKAVGKKYDTFFEEKRQLELTQTDDKTVEFLMKKLGEEVFARLFSVKVSIVAKPDMDRKQFELSDEARALVKQFKAAVKLRK